MKKNKRFAAAIITVCLLLTVSFFSACSAEQSNDFWGAIGEILAKYWKWLLKGVCYTLLVSLISTVIGLIIGMLIGVFRTMPTPKNGFLRVLKKIGDWLLSAYIEVFRGTPMMVQAMVIYWGFALLNNGVRLDPTFSGFIIVSINTGAYMAEIVRGGIISVDKGQFEGAAAIGMTHFQTMISVVLPQVLRNILPSVANEFVVNIKDTSVLNVIGFTELYFQAGAIVAINYKTFQTYLLVAAIYFVLTFTVTRILRLIEKKMDGKENYVVLGSQNMDADAFARENKNDREGA
ncbi:MAG: amino acid ABC transporter permease [Candidatus Neoclostridium sp.]